MRSETSTLGVKNKTKKIISSIIITTLLFSSQTFAGSEKNIDLSKIEVEKYNEKLENYQIADSLYFPGGNYGMGMSKSSGPRTPYTFGENSYGYNLYNYLYFGNSEYENNNFKELFNQINSKFNIEYRTKNKDFSYYNTEEKLKKDLEEVILEIKVAKFRLQNHYNANKYERDIEDKLEKIYNQISKSELKTNSSLDFIRNEENIFCNNDLSIDFNFQTNQLEKNDDITKYYLFGLPYTNYYDGYNKENNINTLYYGAPWSTDMGNSNKSDAFIISKEKDLKNIDKSKFYLQEINPEFKEVGYLDNSKEVEYSDKLKDEIYIPKGGAVLIENKIQEENILINNEATFTLKYDDYLEFFKQNHNLEKSGENYNFGEGRGTKKSFNFILLGVEKNGDVRILTKNSYKDIELDLSKNIDSNILAYCDRTKPEINLKQLQVVEIKINSIFKELDEKYNIQAYKYEKEVLDKNNNKENYIKYQKLINNLSVKVNKIDTKNNNEIYSLLNTTKEKVLENKEKISKKFFTKAILKLLKENLDDKKELFDRMGI